VDGVQVGTDTFATPANTSLPLYIGLQSTENPRKFLFYEQYKDQAALDAHRNAPYFKQYVQGGLDPIMEQRSRDLYTLVE
jgi:quinol monooxygenase YgiN